MTVTPQKRKHSSLTLDVKTGARATAAGMALLAVVDFIVTVVVAPGPNRIATLFRLVFLELALASILFLVALPVTILVALTVRFFARQIGHTSYSGLFARRERKSKDGPQRGASWLWGAYVGILVYLVLSTLATLKLGAMFKEPQLTALVLSVAQLFVAGFAIATAYSLHLGTARLGRRLHRRLGYWNPFGSTLCATVCLFFLGYPVMRLTLHILPQLEPYLPWRHVIALGAFFGGAHLVTRPIPRALQRVLRYWPHSWVHRLGAIAAFVGLFIWTLVRVGADPDTKSLAISSSPTMSRTMDLLRLATDVDGDGFGTLLGENDCAPFDENIHPLARDLPDNGLDENCDGSDFVLGVLPSYKAGQRAPVPTAFQKQWNVLFITIDTVRYDHTGFGGYKRNTTPNLDKLVKRSASFTFANAPSPGTMASVPAIVTSKFFHSGVAVRVEGVKRGMPPILEPQNTLISEVMKAQGYATGAILTHEYFNDWGLDQGVDYYDNTIGKTRDPFRVTSKELTDRAIAWLGKQQKHKWFLWLHYLDPHGRYVSHPGEVSYGDTEMDLYDGELHFTDKHLGRLFEYIGHSPSANNTIIVVTSDHGDAFNEHGYINHGQDLHRELLHVPLIVYIPNLKPRNIPGAVSPIDLFPTIADLIGANVEALGLEGESLVPQLFYDKDAHDRVVFSETDWPIPLRAAINSKYKLILNLKANVARLFDLQKDPWEKQNVWTKDKAGYAKMRGYLNEWLERVYYARDPVSNMAMGKLQKHLVRELPSTAVPIDNVVVGQSQLVVLAVEVGKPTPKPGDTVEVHVYFEVKEEVTQDLRMQAEAWLGDTPQSGPVARSPLRSTAGGLFPTNRWRKGERIRDTFKLKLPAAWRPAENNTRVTLGIRFRPKDSSAAKPPVTGQSPDPNSDLRIIGSFELAATPKEDGTVPDKGTALPALSKPNN